MTPRDQIRPNLFLIGAAKAGTTSLHWHLDGHPDVFMSELKEPAFFVPELDRGHNDVDSYLQLFAQAGDVSVVGESSTHYTKIPIYTGVPERIDRFCDDPRFIYVLRDPIDRIVSHYWYEVRGGVEDRSIYKAVQKESKYKAISDYQLQLEPYFQRFGREKVLILTFEELTDEPESALPRIYRWLGVDPGLVDFELPRKNPRPGEVKMSRGFGLLDWFSRSSLWERVHPLVPGFVRSFGNLLARKRVRPSETNTEPVVEALRPEFQMKVRELERFLGRTFPRWSTTFPDDIESRSMNADTIMA